MAELLKPKGSVGKQDNKAAIEAYAKQSAEAPKEEAQHPLRESVTKLLLGNFSQPVDVPQKTTLGDILRADKNKLGVFADYLKTPEAANLAGLIMGGQRYKDSWSDKLASENGAHFNRDRDIALAQQKQQNELAGMTYKEFNDMDVANMQNELMRDKLAQELDMFGQKLAFERENELYDRNMAQQRMNELIRHNRAMENKTGKH